MKKIGFIVIGLFCSAVFGQTPREALQRNIGTNTVQGTTGAAYQVENIAALQSLNVSALASGTVIRVMGFYSAGDDGGGYFTYNSSSSSTLVLGMTVAPIIGPGRFLRNINVTSWVNVKWCGAKGDGLIGTNDQPSIAAAIVWLGTNGTVFFPKGVYHTTTPITITDTAATAVSYNFVGDSSRSSFVYYTGASSNGAFVFNGAVVYAGPTTPPNGLYIVAATCSCHIEHLGIGSTNGPCITQNFSNKNLFNDILFVSGGVGSEYLLIKGAAQSEYTMLNDLGNDTLPQGITFPAAVTWPANFMYITNGTANDGTHGVQPGICEELFFHDLRTDADYTADGILIAAGAGLYSGQQLGRFYFTNCKFSGEARGSNSNTWANIRINGAKEIRFVNCWSESSNDGSGSTSGMLVDNQLFDSYVYLNHFFTSGNIDLGSPTGSTGNYMISVEADQSAANQLCFNYSANPVAAAWASGGTYIINQIVSNGGSSYICIVAVAGSTTAPGSDATHWLAFTVAAKTYGYVKIQKCDFVVAPLNITNPGAYGQMIYYKGNTIKTLDSIGNATITLSQNVSNIPDKLAATLTLSPTSGSGLVINGITDNFSAQFINALASPHSFGTYTKAGNTSSDICAQWVNASGNLLANLFGDGGLSIGPTAADNGPGTITSNGKIISESTIKAYVGLVSGLPSASPAGQHAYVTDAVATAAAGIGQVVTGGGANFSPVYSDNTNWRQF